MPFLFLPIQDLFKVTVLFLVPFQFISAVLVLSKKRSLYLNLDDFLCFVRILSFELLSHQSVIL